VVDSLDIHWLNVYPHCSNSTKEMVKQSKPLGSISRLNFVKHELLATGHILPCNTETPTFISFPSQAVSWETSQPSA